VTTLPEVGAGRRRPEIVIRQLTVLMPRSPPQARHVVDGRGREGNGFVSRGVCRSEDRLKSCPQLQVRITQLEREASPPPGSHSRQAQVVTEIQPDSSQTDSPVRILYAQPGSPVSTE
jgi:hypothetical protein